VRLLVLAVAAVTGSSALTVGLSDHRPGAPRVGLRLTFESELQCGIPIGPPLVVTLPAAERVPRAVARTAVIVNRQPAAGVTVTGHVLAVKVTRPEVLCDVIGRGTVTIAFTRAAGLGNPSRMGAYRVSVRRGTQTVTGTIVIHT